MSKAPNPPALITSGDSLRPPTASRDVIRPVSPSACKSASSSSPHALPRSNTGSSSIISAASPNASQSPVVDIALPGPARSNVRNSAIFDLHKDPKRKCPRVGMPIYASAGDITPGTGLFARAPPNAGSVAGSPTSVSAFDAVLTVAFTVLVDNQPYLLTAAPLKPEAWKEWGIRIANKLTMDKSKKKVENEKGHGLVSLRSPVSKRSGRGRSGSIVKALESTLSLSSLGIAAGLAGIKQIGTVKSCDLGCDGAFHRRRDWCLIELRANFEGLKTSNTIRIPEDYRQEGGPSELTLKTPQLAYAKSKREVFVVTRNGLRTARTGKPVQDYFCYEGLQELFYTDLEGDGNLYGPRGRDGDAGAPVVDKITGVVYGIVVMANEGKEKSKEREEDKIARLEKEKTVYFVNSYAIMESISGAFPARVVSVATTPEDEEVFQTFLREYDSGVFDNPVEGVGGGQEASKDNTTEQKAAAASSP